MTCLYSYQKSNKSPSENGRRPVIPVAVGRVVADLAPLRGTSDLRASQALVLDRVGQARVELIPLLVGSGRGHTGGAKLARIGLDDVIRVAGTVDAVSAEAALVAKVVGELQLERLLIQDQLRPEVVVVFEPDVVRQIEEPVV